MHDLTTGSIAGHLLRTGGFMLFTMVFQTLYFLVDLYWIGSLGKEAVAAIGLAGNTMFVVLALTQMLGVGTTTLVAHAVGRKDRADARLVFNQSQGCPSRGRRSSSRSASPLSPWLRVGPQRRRPHRGIGARLPALVRPGAGAAVRARGPERRASRRRRFQAGMIVQTSTVVINMLLAPVLIFGWGTGRPMGVAGAAMATLVSVAVGVVWLSRYVGGPEALLRFDRAEITPRMATWRRLLGIGAPAGPEFGLIAVYMVVVYAVSRPFGAEAQAGFGIGQRVIQAGFMPVVALGFAVAPVAGQNFGARRATACARRFELRP